MLLQNVSTSEKFIKKTLTFTLEHNDKLSDHKTELGKKLQKSDGETDDFMKPLTKRLGSKMDYTRLNELIRMIIIFMIIHLKYC